MCPNAVRFAEMGSYSRSSRPGSRPSVYRMIEACGPPFTRSRSVGIAPLGPLDADWTRATIARILVVERKPGNSLELASVARGAPRRWRLTRRVGSSTQRRATVPIPTPWRAAPRRARPACPWKRIPPAELVDDQPVLHGAIGSRAEARAPRASMSGPKETRQPAHVAEKSDAVARAVCRHPSPGRRRSPNTAPGARRHWDTGRMISPQSVVAKLVRPRCRIFPARRSSSSHAAAST
jgi:hypothetical protein